MATKVKKSSKKKTVKKKKGLKKAPSEMTFYMCDGSNCNDLFELSEAIDELADDMFAQHVNEFNNDFANWIEFVFEEPKLAKKLKKAKSKNRHVIEIMRFAVKELK